MTTSNEHQATTVVIEAIVECMDPAYQEDMRARLHTLCQVAREEQRIEFLQFASRLPASSVTH